MRVHGFRLFVACAALGLCGCVQTAGETCQIDSDCDEGLKCEKESQSARGVCIVATDGGNAAGAGGEAALRPDPDAG